jgi:predicted ester cyclase
MSSSTASTSGTTRPSPSHCVVPRVSRKTSRPIRAAYSDARITVDDQIPEGDKVASRWTGRGKHDGDLMGIGPTGKQVTVSGLTLSRLANGKVIEEYTNWDTFGMMQQLDVVPELAHA